jgi:hypothetical protein
MKPFQWIFISLVFTVFACGEASRKDLLPGNTGNKGEIAVVASRAIWNTSDGDVIRSSLRVPMYGLPQEETLLTRLEIDETGFNDHFKTHRNVLKFEIHPDKETKVYIKRNVFARQQVFILIYLKSLDELNSVLEARMPEILNVFYEAEINRLIERNRDLGEKDLNKKISAAFGLNLLIQDNFQIAVEDEHFIWLRLDQSKPLGGYQHTISQGLMIYRRPYTDTLQFTDSSLFEWKSSINKKYVEGPQKSHMSISDRFISPKTKRIIHENTLAVEIRGLWRMEGYFMGGPFYALSFFHSASGMQYMVEGYAYAPQFDKAPLIREIEAMAKSSMFKSNTLN